MTAYPRACCYSATRGSGAPLLNADGSVNVPLVTALARYPVITMNLTPWYAVGQPSRADVLLLLRKLNPRIRILGYTLLGWWYLGPDFTVNPADKTFAGTWHTAIKVTNGFGPANGTGWMVRWENPATEAALTDLLCGAAASRLFDGLFFDFMTGTTPAAAAMQRMIARVRAAGGPGFLVLGNGRAAESLNTDGSMREGFPDYFGHDFGHIQQWRAVRPHRDMDWLQAGTGLTSLDTPEAQRAARFALGTSCLFGTLCSVGPDRDLKVAPSYMGWWLPEYDGGGIGTGWLGEPMGPATQQWFGWRRDFAGGVVVLNDGAAYFTATLPKGLCRFDGVEVGTVTVPAMDSVFLVRAR